MNDDTQDVFELQPTRWPLSASSLRLWCHCHSLDAIRDALDISHIDACDGGGVIIVADDLHELRMPLSAFQRIATPMEEGVVSPSGVVLPHCDGINARTLVAMLLAFVAEVYTPNAEAVGAAKVAKVSSQLDTLLDKAKHRNRPRDG